MTAQLDVTLHGRLIATITNIPGDINVVAIDRDYANDPDATPISFKAFRDPVTGNYRDTIRPTQTRVHPYFSNLLPEGPLRAYLATRASVKSVRDFPLLWLLGIDLPGALILRDHEGMTVPPAEHGPGEEGHDVANDETVLRFSLAGVQLKFSATGTPQRGLTIPAGGIGGDWIVKLPDQRFNRVPENEFGMMSFAREVGIEVPTVGLVDPAEVVGLPSDVRNVSGQAFYIKRFDRTDDGERIHTEDFAQANMIYPEQKYKRFNFDMLAEQVADLTGASGSQALIARIIFNIGIGNGDMHAKNWSLIYRDGYKVALAPAYDYVSTVVYMPNDDMGMNLAGTKRFADVDDELLARFAVSARLPRKPVLDAAHDMVERMREVWPKISGDLPIEKAHRAIIETHMNSVPLFGPRTALARR